MSVINPGNRLNALSAPQWLRFTKSWFVHNPPPRKKQELLHPAKYPEALITEFISFFTKPGEIVFDPFLGTGSTIVAAHTTGRTGIGVELQQKYARVAQQRLQDLSLSSTFTPKDAPSQSSHRVIHGNSLHLDTLWKKHSLPLIDFVITSPPYGPMLHKKGLVTKDRKEKGLDLKYSNDSADLGNITEYTQFIKVLIDVFVTVKPKLKSGKYIVIILQNYMDKGEYKTLAWDVATALKPHFQLRGERLWCQDNKTLYPYGYRYSYVPNVHHHYCLIFRKV